ncbi:MAG: response regulator transcription factor [Candidatus Sedimenticola endophacoides]
MAEGECIQLLLADDHPLLLEGIVSRLSSVADIEVVGQANNGQQVLDMVAEVRPDVVMMDLAMPVMNGLEATRQLKQDYPDLRILILSMHDDREYIVQLMRAGASGYVLKDVSSAELVNAIRAVSQGNTHFSSGASQSLFGSDVSDGVLTPREEDVLKLLAEGNNKQIARELDISVRTVEKHRQNIKAKLNIGTTSGLIRYAIEHKLIGLGST